MQQFIKPSSRIVLPLIFAFAQVVGAMSVPALIIALSA